jgi:hypothetical protein
MLFVPFLNSSGIYEATPGNRLSGDSEIVIRTRNRHDSGSRGSKNPENKPYDTKISSFIP